MKKRARIYSKFFVCILLLFFSKIAFSTVIKGTVVDEERTPITGAACVSFSLPDSVYFASSTTNELGNFELPCPDTVEWIVNISYIGYSSKTLSLSDFIGGDSIIVELRRPTKELNELVVKATKPQLVQKDGALCYTDLSNILQTRVIGSAHELLKNLPLITSTDDNSLKLSGAPLGSEIHINGRRTQMSQSQIIDYLKNIPANQIKEVQIMYTPDPKWKTRNAVINVIIKNPDDYSINGMGQAGATYRRYLSENAGASAFVGLPKTSLNVMYSFSDNHSVSKETSLAKHYALGIVNEIEDTTRTKSKSQTHGVYAQLSRQIDDKNNIEGSYYGQFSPSTSSGNKSSNSKFGQYVSDNSGNSELHSANVYFSNTNGINIGAAFSHFNSYNHQIIWKENGNVLDKSLSGISRQTVNSVRTYADFNTSLPKKWHILYGASFEYSHNSNILSNKSDTDIMESEDSNTKLDEKKTSVYLGAYRYFFNNRFFLRGSLAGEFYKIGDYTNNQFMPTITAYFMPNNTHILQASYREYRVYPSYWQRQSYISYSNPYAMNMGNPNLKPSRYKVAALTYVLMGKYTASLSYYHVGDFFLNQVYQSQESLTQINQPVNIDFSSLWSIDISIPLSFSKRVFSDITLSGARERFKSSDWHGIKFDKFDLTGLISIDNTILLSTKPKVALNLAAAYITPKTVGLWERSHAWMLNAGISAAYLDGRLVVNLHANDLLQTLYAQNRMRVASQWLNLDSNYYNRSISLNISYKFKSYKSLNPRKPDTSRLGIK